MNKNFKWFATVYAAYFGSLAVFQPYMTLWLDHWGYSVFWVAIFSAMIRGLNIFTPVLWAGWVSNKPYPFRWALAGFGACAVVTMLFGVFNGWSSPWVVGAFLCLFCSIYWGLGPQIDGLALPWVKQHGIEYGDLRLWGSIGFAMISFLAGYLISQVSAHWFTWMIVIGLLLAMLGLTKFWDHKNEHIHHDSSVFNIKDQWNFIMSCKNHPTIRWIFGVAFLVNVGFAAYFIFFALVLKNEGYSGWMIGLLYAFATVCEILAFKKVSWFFKRWSLEKLVMIALLLTIGRWLCVAWFPGSTILMFMAQATHAFGFALLHSCSMKIIDLHIKPSHHGLGMGVLNSLTFGVGSAIGALVLGLCWEWGGREWAFMSATLITGVAFIMTLFKKDEVMLFANDSQYFVNQAYEPIETRSKEGV